MVTKLYVNFHLSLLCTFLGSVKISLYNEKQFLISRDSLSCPDWTQPRNEDFPVNNSVLALPELYTNDNEPFKNTLLLLSKEFCQMDLDRVQWEKNELGGSSGKTGLSLQPPMNTTLLSFSWASSLPLVGMTNLPTEPRTEGAAAHRLSVQKLRPSWAKNDELGSLPWATLWGAWPQERASSRPSSLGYCRRLTPLPPPEISPEPPSSRTDRYWCLPRSLSH